MSLRRPARMDNNTVVIFDMDGVMVNTVESLYQIYLDVLRNFQITGNLEEFNILNGPQLDEIVSLLIEKHKIKVSPPEMKQMFLQHFDLLYDKADLIIGFLETLKSLRSKQ